MKRINECSCGCGSPSGMCKKERAGSELNYMFFGNLKTLKTMVDSLMQMDQMKIDSILKDGHDWAVDHIASSVDDVQEVYNFLMNNLNHSVRAGHDAFAEDELFVKTFESYLLSESKKSNPTDQDEDGDNDFADAKIPQYMAGGLSREEAIEKSRKFNKKGK